MWYFGGVFKGFGAFLDRFGGLFKSFGIFEFLNASFQFLDTIFKFMASSLSCQM